MYKEFAWDVRRALKVAAWEARRLGQRQVDVEHVLLALIGSDVGLVNGVLEDLGLDIDETIAQVENDLNPGVAGAAEELPLTPQVKRAIAAACEESQAEGRPWVQAEDLLLGLLRDRAGAPARRLEAQGVDLEQLRDALFPVLGGEPGTGGGLIPAKFTADQELMAEVYEVMRAWPELPEASRKRVLEMIRKG